MSKTDTLMTSDSPPISPLSGFRPPRPSQSQKSKTSKSSPAPLLITESRQEYKRMRRALKKEICPQGPIERMYFTDISNQQWEIRRLRWAKVALLNTAFREVLEHFLPELLCGPDRESWEFRDKARVMSFAWYSEPEVQVRVAKRLAGYGLDATAIEAKVLEHCSFTVCGLRSSSRLCGIALAAGSSCLGRFSQLASSPHRERQ